MRIGITTCNNYAAKTVVPIMFDLYRAGNDEPNIYLFGLKGWQQYEDLSFILEYVDSGYAFDLFVLPDTCRIYDPILFNEYLKSVAEKACDGHDYIGIRDDIDMCHIGLYTSKFIKKIYPIIKDTYFNKTKLEKIELEINGWLKNMADNYGSVPVCEEWVKQEIIYGDIRWQRKWSCGLIKYTKHRLIDELR